MRSIDILLRQNLEVRRKTGSGSLVFATSCGHGRAQAAYPPCRKLRLTATDDLKLHLQAAKGFRSGIANQTLIRPCMEPGGVEIGGYLILGLLRESGRFMAFLDDRGRHGASSGPRGCQTTRPAEASFMGQDLGSRIAAGSIRRTFSIALALALLPLGDAVATPTALVAARIIDGRSDTVSPHTVVLVEGDRITALGGREIIPTGATVIELGDATLMPGMINAHEHPLMYASDYQQAHLANSSAYKALMGLVGLQRLLLAGWTGVRVMGDADVFYANQDLRRAIDSGVFIGPRITGAAHYISITGGGGDINYLSPEQHVRADGLVADGPEEIRKAIREEIKYGSDWIKLLVTGAFESVGDNPRNIAFSPEELRAAVEEANRHGVPVAAHAHATEGIKQAVAAGVRSIEHGTYIDDETMRMMAKRGTFLVPTVYLGDYYEESEEKLRAQDKNDEYIKHGRKDFLAAIARAHRTGVKVVVGLDLGVNIADPHVYAREFAVFVEAGMSPMAAIQAGTRVAAELMRWDDRLGTLERGKLADVIAVSGNPLADIKALEQVSMVMLNGRVLKRPGEQLSLAGLLPAPQSGR